MEVFDLGIYLEHILIQSYLHIVSPSIVIFFHSDISQKSAEKLRFSGTIKKFKHYSLMNVLSISLWRGISVVTLADGGIMVAGLKLGIETKRRLH